jgi:hypothetical protein
VSSSRARQQVHARSLATLGAPAERLYPEGQVVELVGSCGTRGFPGRPPGILHGLLLTRLGGFVIALQPELESRALRLALLGVSGGKTRLGDRQGMAR